MSSIYAQRAENVTGLPCWLDDSFGPVVRVGTCEDTRDVFDFTLLFEQSIMSVGPSVLLLLAVPLRWLQLRSQSRKTKRGENWASAKLVSYTILLLSNIDSILQVSIVSRRFEFHAIKFSIELRN